MSEYNTIDHTAQDDEEKDVGQVHDIANNFLSQRLLCYAHLLKASTVGHRPCQAEQTKAKEDYVESQGYESDGQWIWKSFVKPICSDNVKISGKEFEVYLNLNIFQMELIWSLIHL